MEELMPDTPKMKVEVWSDIMCPFCYIGKRNYQNALKQFAQARQLELEWKSFQLDPSIPEDLEPGLSAVEYLASRKGLGLERIQEMHAQVTQMAERAGLDYNLNDTKVYNSMKAHRIIQMAKTKGMGDQAEETFFKAHFTHNKDLGNTTVLIELAQSFGLSQDMVLEALDNEVYLDRVKEDIYEAQQVGARGVPYFVFNRKYTISGAQPVETFLQALEQSFTDWRTNNPVQALDSSGGLACTPEGNCD